jgi:hypothetical protein
VCRNRNDAVASLLFFSIIKLSLDEFSTTRVAKSFDFLRQNTKLHSFKYASFLSVSENFKFYADLCPKFCNSSALITKADVLQE